MCSSDLGQAAAAENASTIFFNPSGMTLVPGRQVTGTLNIIRPQTEFTDNGGSRSPANVAAPGGGSNGNDAGGWNYVPNAFMSWQFSDRLWAGIGLTVPFGLKTNYDPTFIGRFQSQKSQYMRVSGLIARFSPAPRARKRCRCMTAPGAGMPAP